MKMISRRDNDCVIVVLCKIVRTNTQYDQNYSKWYTEEAVRVQT